MDFEFFQELMDIFRDVGDLRGERFVLEFQKSDTNRLQALQDAWNIAFFFLESPFPC